MIRLLVAATLVVGCGGDPAPPPAEPDAAAGTGTLTIAERRARYDKRPAVKPPRDMPERWRTLAEKMDARLGRVDHEVRSRWGEGEPFRRIRVELRVFGTDAAVEARLLSALSALGLPGLSAGLPTGEVTKDEVTWGVAVRRFVAPPGEPREAIVTLDWRRVPTDPPEPPRCKKPKSVKAPRESPKWMRVRSSRMTTRHRVGARVAIDPDGTRVSMLVLFRNGETQAGDLTKLVALAKRLKLTLDHEDGVTQRWTGRTTTMEWRTESGKLHLGCTLTGPVLELSWTKRKR